MKVLNIVTTPLSYEGISISALNYFRNIDKDKIKMDFLAPEVNETIKKEIEKKSGKVYLLKERKRHPFKYMKNLKELIKKNKYDIVHVNGSSAMLCIEMIAAKKAGCKIRIAHSHNTKTNYKIIDKILRPIFYKTYTYGIACGDEAGKWLFGKRSFEILNNATDIEKFKFNELVRDELRKKNRLEGKIVIGHVGNFNEQKNHDFLIDIFSDLIKQDDKYYLVLIGEGHLEESIKQKVKKLGLKDRVCFVGQSKEVERWLQAMDIMLLPSKFEGFPNVLVEWQIAGLPCIVSDKVTGKVKLTDLVEFASIEDGTVVWKEKIKNIKIEDRNKNREQILKLIREKGFDIKENANRLENIYESLVRNAGECNND